jgi:hypothetical protein
MSSVCGLTGKKIPIEDSCMCNDANDCEKCKHYEHAVTTA